jgi:flagellar basal-body rod modification protein FlgD
LSISSISNQKTIQQIINDGAKSTEDRKTGELDKDQFLNLLVTQLKYQDPLNPVDDKEFIGQMAQFSSLEQMQNLNSTFSSSKAFSMIGKTVSASVKSETGDTSDITGVVSNVKLAGGKPLLVIDGKEVEVESVTNVSEENPFAESNISAFTGLIGFDVKAGIQDNETGEVVTVKGIVKELVSEDNIDYAVIDNTELNIGKLVTQVPMYTSEEKQNYLESMKGETIEAVFVDPLNGRQVQGKGELVDFNIDYIGGITATLNNIQVPVESISRIKIEGF